MDVVSAGRANLCALIGKGTAQAFDLLDEQVALGWGGANLEAFIWETAVLDDGAAPMANAIRDFFPLIGPGKLQLTGNEAPAVVPFELISLGIVELEGIVEKLY
jgi:hypothetical protein